MSGPAGVALAAGAGTRLRPLTTLRPKALCPVGGVALLDHAVGLLTAVAADVAVNAHHHADQLVAHVGDRGRVAVERPEALGTAGALGNLRPWLDGRDVLVVNADAYLTPAPGGDRAGVLGQLLSGWGGDRCRLLVAPTDGRADFVLDGAAVRYVGACLLPWRLVAGLAAEPGGLYEVLWRREHDAGRLDLVRHAGTAIDCGTPADYLRANLHASGGVSVVGAGATVDGRIDRCVVWPDAHVARDEHLVECVRAGTRDAPLTVDARLDAPTPGG